MLDKEPCHIAEQILDIVFFYFKKGLVEFLELLTVLSVKIIR